MFILARKISHNLLYRRGNYWGYLRVESRFLGGTSFAIVAAEGDLIQSEPINETVGEGQPLMIQRYAFGEVVR
jgi:hypothetical protein